MPYKLLKPFTDKEKADFVCKHQCLNHYEDEKGFYFLENNETIKNGEIIVNPDYEAEQIQGREEQFAKDFFLTSLGYVRRKAYIQGTGETKDFLSDCFPVLCNAFSLGQNIQAIIYDKPSMDEDISDWTQYQKEINWTKAVQQTFLAECLLQYQKDFFGA